MAETFTCDAFISHRANDTPVARELAGRLTRDGLRVWFADSEIRPGDSIPLKIEQGLEESRTLVLVMSKNAVAFEWVTLERRTARLPRPDQRGAPLHPVAAG